AIGFLCSATQMKPQACGGHYRSENAPQPCHFLKKSEPRARASHPFIKSSAGNTRQMPYRKSHKKTRQLLGGPQT
ncbi:hypothetical protein N9X02_08825, partial [Planktomarina temperata]|nr:hypothetical protein [Planktomarina temperata]